MLKILAVLIAAACLTGLPVRACLAAQTDVLKTADSEAAMTLLGHGTLYFTYKGKVYHVDPWTKLADYAKLPKADAILITHEHRDHLDPEALAAISRPDTVIIVTETVAKQFGKGEVMKNGDVRALLDINVAAVPAYNIEHKRDNGQPFHPKGVGNGYVLTFGDKKVYVAGDTENIPEMADLKGVDVAFLPMNLPYTMTPEMAAAAAKSFRPKVLYPYHYGETDPQKLVDLLKDSPEIEVRVRDMR